MQKKHVAEIYYSGFNAQRITFREGNVDTIQFLLFLSLLRPQSQKPRSFRASCAGAPTGGGTGARIAGVADRCPRAAPQQFGFVRWRSCRVLRRAVPVSRSTNGSVPNQFSPHCPTARRGSRSGLVQLDPFSGSHDASFMMLPIRICRILNRQIVASPHNGPQRGRSEG